MLDWATIIFVSIIVLAVISRFWDLGARALHHDESLHATYSYYLYIGRGYVHDPLLHGTFIYIFNALVYLLLGASDATARVAPSFLGVLTVALPMLLRKQLGRWGALATSGLLLISPSFLYFGRFIREDAHIAFFTLAMVVCLFRYFDSRRPLYLYLFGGLLALSFATKETTFMTLAIFGSFLFMVAGVELLRLLRRSPKLSPAGDFLVVMGTLAAPQVAGLAILYKTFQGQAIQAYPTPEEYRILFAVFLALVALSAVVGLRWNARRWLIVAGVFYGLFAILFTTLFSNPPGLVTGAVGGLVYWLAQQSVKRGGQPWQYYLVLMPLYEYLTLAFAIPGAIYFAWRRTLFSTFLIYWAVAGLVLFSWAGEKMPWLVLHVALPFILLAGMTLGRLLPSIPWRERLRDRALLVGALLVGLAIALGLANTPKPAGFDLTRLDVQQPLLQWALLVALLTAVVFVGLRAVERLGLRGALATAAAGSLVVLVPLTIHTAVEAAYVNGDTPVEMIVYTQTSPDVPKVMQGIEHVAFLTGAGKNLKVAYDNEVTWPFEWYLRDYPNRNYYGSGLPAADAPVVLVGVDNNHDAQVRAQLGSNYVGQRYRLRWWFPEDYRTGQDFIRALTPPDERANLAQTTSQPGILDIIRAMLRPEARDRLWKYLLYRQPLNPLGSTDFVLYVRKDLVDGAWMPATVAPTTAAAQDPFEMKAVDVAATQTIGPSAGEAGQLNGPKNVALAGDGSVYVLDTGNNRVLKFDRNGQYQLAWGQSGAEPGQFNEPWGIAVDGQGNVYVADTWNHRIEKFDSQGKFLLQWGGFGDSRDQPDAVPGLFYGPRGLAVDADGNLLVVDSGNKRVQKFSPDGQLLGQYGSQGGGDGLFSEPVGIAVDSKGNVYVADTWNHRIQKFDGNMKYLSQWEVPGWVGESVVNKPFLAVDASDNVYVTDPEAHRVLKFSSEGQALATWGRFGNDARSVNLPLGIAVDGKGQVYVADSGNQRITVYPPTP